MYHTFSVKKNLDKNNASLIITRLPIKYINPYIALPLLPNVLREFITAMILFFRELNRNKIKEINALTFKYLEHLKTLKLKRNQISELKDGAFYGLISIDKL